MIKPLNTYLVIKIFEFQQKYFKTRHHGESTVANEKKLKIDIL